MGANVTAIGNGLSTAFGNAAGLRCGMTRKPPPELWHVVRANVRRVLKVKDGDLGINALKALGMAHGNAQRVLREDDASDFQLSRLAQLAAWLHVEPWELLVPGLDSDERPQLVTTDARPGWPFTFQASRLDDLDQREIGMIEHAARVELERIEAERRRRMPLAPIDPPANDAVAKGRKNSNE